MKNVIMSLILVMGLGFLSLYGNAYPYPKGYSDYNNVDKAYHDFLKEEVLKYCKKFARNYAEKNKKTGWFSSPPPMTPGNFVLHWERTFDRKSFVRPRKCEFELQDETSIETHIISFKYYMFSPMENGTYTMLSSTHAEILQAHKFGHITDIGLFSYYGERYVPFFIAITYIASSAHTLQ